MKLENWSLVYTEADPYHAPELCLPHLHGIVHGHPAIADGEEITTSSVRGKRGEALVTRNSVYELGTIDPAYEKQFPDAKKRLLDNLQEVP
jgi:hypothetical protein